MSSRFHHLRLGCILFLPFFMASCSLTQTLKKPEGEKDFFQETLRLEILTREHPKTSVRAQSHLQLAFLFVNYRNPELDYNRAFREMKSYFSLTPANNQPDDFRNWLAVLQEIDLLSKDRTEMGNKNQALKTHIENLQNSLDEFHEANKNLCDEVANLKETIEILKRLDRQMEEKRSHNK